MMLADISEQAFSTKVSAGLVGRPDVKRTALPIHEGCALTGILSFTNGYIRPLSK